MKPKLEAARDELMSHRKEVQWQCTPKSLLVNQPAKCLSLQRNDVQSKGIQCTLLPQSQVTSYHSSSDKHWKANDIIVTNLMSYLKGSNVHVFVNHYMSLK